MPAEPDAGLYEQPNRSRSISLVIPLVVMLAAWSAHAISSLNRLPPTRNSPMPEFDRTSLTVRRVADQAGIATIRQAGRSIIFVDAPYSVPARESRQVFVDAMLQLKWRNPAIDAGVFVIEDDSAEWCMEWITSLGVAGLRDVAIPVGAGAILWMEHGRVVRFQLGHEIKDAYEIRRQTVTLWNLAS